MGAVEPVIATTEATGSSVHSVHTAAPDVEEAATIALRWAIEEGIALDLTEDRVGILAGPPERLTDEFRQLVQAAHDRLIRQLLFREALAYYQRHLDHAGAGGSFGYDTRTGTYRRRLTEEDDRLGEAWLDSSIEEFKEALRNWLKGRLRAHHEAAGARADGMTTSSGQPTLLEVK